MAGGSKDMKNAVVETIPGKKVSCVAILNIYMGLGEHLIA